MLRCLQTKMSLTESEGLWILPKSYLSWKRLQALLKLVLRESRYPDQVWQFASPRGHPAPHQSNPSGQPVSAK